MSSILSRAVTLWRSGLLFGGNRDLYKTFGWVRNPQHAQFVDMYFHQDIAGRVNDSLPKALWADPPEVSGGGGFTDAWISLLTQQPVFSIIQRLDKIAGLGRFAILVMGFDDSRSLNQPVSKKEGRKVIYLQPYAEGQVQVTKYETNTSSPRFGMPVMYKVSTGSLDPMFSAQIKSLFTPVQSDFEVHHSRILHVAEGALESVVFGHSRLEPVYNVLTDIAKISGASAETYWLAGNRGLHVDIDKDMELDPEDAENMSDELKEYEHELRRIIRTRGAKINPLGSAVADPRGAFDVQVSLLASRTGIPKRVLMGSEAGQLASQQDRAEWALRVAEQVNEYGGPIVLYPLLRQLIDAGVLPQPQSLTVKWPDAFKMNPLERAQTSAQMARSAANLSKTLQTIEQMNQSAATARQATTQETKDPLTGATSSQEVPVIIQGTFKEIILLTPEECRSIIGFGKHPPIFDTTEDVPAAVQTPGSV